MSDINFKFVFCDETLQKTIKFTLETLKKCINILEPVLRKSRELTIESSLNKVYHAQCYRLFTAIKIPRDIQYLQEQNFRAGESSDIQEGFEVFNNSFNTDEPAAHNDSASQACFICEKQRKRRHGREVRLAVNRLKTIESFKNAATEQNDIPMLEKLSSFYDDSKMPYHKCCKDQYLREIYKDENSEFRRIKRFPMLRILFFVIC